MAKVSFEKALDQLEHIVKEMESGNLTLEQSLKKFEEGMKLSKYCTQKLEETEKKISLLTTQSDGSVRERSFDDDDGTSVESIDRSTE